VLAVTRTGEHGVREILEAESCEVIASDRTLLGLGASLAAGVAASADARAGSWRWPTCRSFARRHSVRCARRSSRAR
jgi:hypothetical protein